MTEIQKQANLDAIRVMLRKCRCQYEEADKTMAKIFNTIKNLQIAPDEIPTSAENADNLEHAICCFLQYGEYNIEGIIAEISEAMPPVSEVSTEGKKTRIFLAHHHLASLDSELLLDFRHKFEIVNFVAWVKEQAKEDYGIVLTDKASIVELTERVKEDYWSNIGDWLTKKMYAAVSGSPEKQIHS